MMERLERIISKSPRRSSMAISTPASPPTPISPVGINMTPLLASPEAMPDSNEIASRLSGMTLCSDDRGPIAERRQSRHDSARRSSVLTMTRARESQSPLLTVSPSPSGREQKARSTSHSLLSIGWRSSSQAGLGIVRRHRARANTLDDTPEKMGASAKVVNARKELFKFVGVSWRRGEAKNRNESVVDPLSPDHRLTDVESPSRLRRGSGSFADRPKRRSKLQSINRLSAPFKSHTRDAALPLSPISIIDEKTDVEEDPPSPETDTLGYSQYPFRQHRNLPSKPISPATTPNPSASSSPTLSIAALESLDFEELHRQLSWDSLHDESIAPPVPPKSAARQQQQQRRQKLRQQQPQYTSGPIRLLSPGFIPSADDSCQSSARSSIPCIDPSEDLMDELYELLDAGDNNDVENVILAEDMVDFFESFQFGGSVSLPPTTTTTDKRKDSTLGTPVHVSGPGVGVGLTDVELLDTSGRAVER